MSSMESPHESVKEIALDVWKNNRPLAIAALVAALGAGYVLYRRQQAAGTPSAPTSPTSPASPVGGVFNNTYISTTNVRTSTSTVLPAPAPAPTPVAPPVPAPSPNPTPMPGGIIVNKVPLIPDTYKVWFGRGNQIYYGTSLQDQKWYPLPAGYSLRAGSDGRYWLIKGNIQQLLTNHFYYNGL